MALKLKTVMADQTSGHVTLPQQQVLLMKSRKLHTFFMPCIFALISMASLNSRVHAETMVDDPPPPFSPETTDNGVLPSNPADDTASGAVAPPVAETMPAAADTASYEPALGHPPAGTEVYVPSAEPYVEPAPALKPQRSSSNRIKNKAVTPEASAEAPYTAPPYNANPASADTIVNPTATTANPEAIRPVNEGGNAQDGAADSLNNASPLPPPTPLPPAAVMPD